MGRKARNSRKRAVKRLLGFVIIIFTVLKWLFGFILTAVTLWEKLFG